MCTRVELLLPAFNVIKLSWHVFYSHSAAQLSSTLHGLVFFFLFLPPVKGNELPYVQHTCFVFVYVLVFHASHFL